MARKKQPPAAAPATVTPLTTSLCVPAAPAATCSNCRHWKPLGDDLGQCRRFPPTVIHPNQLTPRGPIVTFNVTSHDTSCGEHLPIA
jgi:hypothetical protein